MLRKNVSGQFVYFQGVDVSTGGIKSGVTWTMRRCLDGTFAAGGATITEDSTNGWYKAALTQADTNGNDLGYNFTGTGAVPVTITAIATAADPTDGVHFGLSALPNTACTTNASLLTSGTSTDQLSVTSGRIDIGKALGTAVTLDSNNVLNVSAKYLAGTALTGRDIGASVLLSSGTGTGQVKLASGYIAPNWGDVGNPTTTVGLTGTTISTSQVVASVTGAVGSVTGRVTANTDQLAGQTVTAAAGVTFPTSVASPTNITAGTITTVTNLTNAPTAGDLTAAMKTSVENSVWDATQASHVAAGSTGKSLSNASSAGDPWSTAIPGAYGAGTAGNIVGNNLDVAVSSRLATAGYTAPPSTASITTAILTTQMTESYPALHTAPTLAQSQFEMRAILAEKSVSGTTMTVNKIDGSTLAETYTLNDATAPTAITRAT